MPGTDEVARSASSLSSWPLWRFQAQIPFGDVLAMSLSLASPVAQANPGSLEAMASLTEIVVGRVPMSAIVPEGSVRLLLHEETLKCIV